MAGPDVALGLVGAVDVTIKWGTVLVNTCSAFKHAAAEIQQRVLRVELCWKQTSLQLDFLRRVWGELDDRHQLLQEEILLILTTTLSAANSRLNSLRKDEALVGKSDPDLAKPRIRKMKRVTYALLKDHLDRTIYDMEAWQKRFDPSWYLILRIASGRIDEELHKTATEQRNIKTASGIRDSLRSVPEKEVHVLLPENELESARIIGVPFSSTKIMYRSKTNEPYILDSVPCPSTATFNERKKAVRDLARKLTNADPTKFALLKCVGFVAMQASNQFTLVFKHPSRTIEPQSLRTSLLSSTRNHSLSDRFHLTNHLATAVSSVHNLGFVHKSIRPENIVMFPGQDSKIGSGYLLGFEHARLEDGRTRLVGDSDWEKNVYRHPQRQGARLEEPYKMQHDIYSLGVCLLEIGLWTSFVRYSDNNPDPVRPETFKFGVDSQAEAERAESVKSELLALATDTLSSHMGSKYAKVVQTCLTCLDEACDDFGDESEFQDEDGVLVAVRYIEKILSQLNGITV